MRIAANEFWKVASKRSFLLAFVLFLGANAVFVMTDDHGHLYHKNDYRNACASMEELPYEEQLSYTEENCHALAKQQYGETDTKQYAKRLLYETLYQDLLDIGHYPDYVEKTIKEAAGENAVSIFRKQDSFSVRNAKKTGEVFANLAHVQPRFQNSAMVNQMLSAPSTDIFLALLLFFACSVLIMEEKEEGMFSLFKPLKKRTDKADGGKDSGTVCDSGCFKRIVSFGKLSV